MEKMAESGTRPRRPTHNKESEEERAAMKASRTEEMISYRETAASTCPAALAEHEESR